VTAAITDMAVAADAARAAAPLLPATTPLEIGMPSQQADAAPLDGQAIRARFTGAAHGRVAVIVGRALIDALAGTAMGGLELTQVLRPALEAAATTLGPVTVDPGEQVPAHDALAAIVAAGGAYVPLTGEGGGIAAVVSIAVDRTPGAPAQPVAPTAPEPAGPAAVSAPAQPAPAGGTDLGLLHDVELEVTAELGRTRMSVRELLALAPGAVIELDRAAGGPVDLLVNDRVIARGEVVVIDESFGIRITEIVTGGR
jgi:flagellar motor switch protein FliN/FliY